MYTYVKILRKEESSFLTIIEVKYEAWQITIWTVCYGHFINTCNYKKKNTFKGRKHTPENFLTSFYSVFEISSDHDKSKQIVRHPSVNGKVKINFPSPFLSWVTSEIFKSAN